MLGFLVRSTLMVKCCRYWGSWCGSAASRWSCTPPWVFTKSTLFMLKPAEPARRGGIAFDRCSYWQTVRQPDTRSKDYAYGVLCLSHKSLATALHTYHSSQSAYARNGCPIESATMQQTSDARSHPHMTRFPQLPGKTYEMIHSVNNR
jgi:hypothetical protein